MPRDAAEILKDALALPIEARAALIGPLVDSLDTEVDEHAEEAWREEILRRLQEIDSGTTELVRWDEARRRLAGSGLPQIQLGIYQFNVIELPGKDNQAIPHSAEHGGRVPNPRLEKADPYSHR
jgi:putative addiction module component (TIGR02574 family)